MRSLILPAFIGVAVCGAWTSAVAAAATDRLFRSSGPEVRFRCGSELLRAKLRSGRLVVQTASGQRAILSPVIEPRAVAQSPAYGDGRLTLYKVKGPQIWALARTGQTGAPTRCTLQPRVP